jgi:ABC-type sugar transport system substrate-binding protein
MRHRQSSIIRRAAITAVSLAALALAACSSGSSSSSGGSTQGGSGSLENQGAGKTIVFFSNPTTFQYVGKLISSAKDEASRFGYKLEVIQDNATQANLDQLVQQYLAGGTKPAAFIFWPFIPAASVNDVRLLSRVAPVFQVNQEPTEAALPYVTAYAGIGNKVAGQEGGKLMMDARTAAVAKGKKLHSSDGNLLYFSDPAGYQAGDDHVAGFKEATASAPFNILTVQNTEGTQQGSYTVASQVIAKYKDQGIDFVVANSDPELLGAMKALEASGIKPGADVALASMDCSSGGRPLQISGVIYGTLFQGPQTEGREVVDTVVKYFAAGKKVLDGSITEPAGETAPTVTAAAPHKYNYIPTPPMTSKNIESTRLWGLTSAEGCP